MIFIYIIKMNYLNFFILFIFWTRYENAILGLTVPYKTPAECMSGSGTGSTPMYFDPTELKCMQCPANQIVRPDGLGCVCASGFRRDSGSQPCIQCGATGQVASFNGWDCVGCYDVAGVSKSCSAGCNSDNREIPVERSLTGSWYNNQANRRSCVVCAVGTKPDASGRRCEICNKVPPTGIVDASECDCAPNRLFGGLCFRDNVNIASSQDLFQVQFGSSAFDSQYFEDNLQAASAQCTATYTNSTACQLVRNLCALSVYREIQGEATACSLHKDYITSLTGSAGIVSLFYSDTARSLLSDISIPVRYTFPNSKLDIILSSYSLDGRFLGFVSAQDGVLQLCENTFGYLNAAYLFGTVYKQECTQSVKDFWNADKHKAVLYEAWLRYSTDSTDQIYSIPVLIRNYQNKDGREVNSGDDRSQWQMVRRFFLVDNISGKQTVVPGKDPAESSIQNVRYAQSIIFHIELQPDDYNGRILPPWIEINYAVATPEDFNNDKSVKVNFQMLYQTNEGNYRYGMSVAIAVLAALAFPYTLVQTWGWAKRSGKLALDFLALLKFLLFACGNLSNAFFCVTLGSALWWLIFYKRQHNVYLLVDEGRNSYFLGFLASAFTLKAIQLFHIYFCQVIVDIFFIDWERPSGKASNNKDVSDSVSIWRTYFVANEWNELQTERKLSPMFQYFVSVLILCVIGVSNISSMDPQSHLTTNNPDMYYAPVSNVLRFAIIGFVYILVAVAQWLYFTFIYERFFEDKLGQFVDLCSLCNVSVFILENQLYGYYIHGRSVHGRADIGLREMHENFIKEKNDLCGKRGLQTDSELQTFQISVPHKFRSIYDRIIMPLLQARANRTAGKVQTNLAGYSTHLDPLTESSVEAYSLLTQALQSFIDHSIRDADYIVKPKSLIQHLLNVEFENTSVIGSFYNDKGQSFSNVLLFGHEVTLILFEILLIAVLDLATHNFLLDIVITYFIVEVLLKAVRDGMGRSNLARKTLVDKRFLV